MAPHLLDNEFNRYWLMLTAVEKESLLNVAKTYVQLKQNATDTDIEQYNKEIDEAVARVKAGEFYTHEEVLNMSKEW